MYRRPRSKAANPDLNAAVAAFTERTRKRAVILATREYALTWSDFRFLLIEYADADPERGRLERTAEALILNFGSAELRLPLLSLLAARTRSRGDGAEATLIQPLQAWYQRFEARLRGEERHTQAIPLRLRAEWLRRAAIDYPWEGKILRLRRDCKPLQDLLSVEQAHLRPPRFDLRRVRAQLSDAAVNMGAITAFAQDLDSTTPQWESDVLTAHRLEELRGTWSRRYPSLALLHASTAASPTAQIVRAVWHAFLHAPNRSSRKPTHEQLAKEAFRDDPRSLYALAQMALRFGAKRTAWQFLLRSTSEVPREAKSDPLVRYQYPPTLLSMLSELAAEAGTADIAGQLSIWFEERVLAATSMVELGRLDADTEIVPKSAVRRASAISRTPR